MYNAQLRTKDQEELWNNNVMINRVEMDNKSQWINSKNNAWDLVIIKLCKVICCEAINFYSISDYHSKWPALLVQDMSVTSGAKKVFPCLGNVNSVNALLANTAAELGKKQGEH